MAPRIQPEIEGIPKEYYQDKKPAMLIAISDTNNSESEVEEYVGRFLKGGWSVDTADEDGNTALMYAVDNRRYLTVLLLMRNGANPMIPNNNGRIPMHIAARWGLLRHMKELYGNELKKRDRDTAQLDAVDNEGMTPLMWAAFRGRIQCVVWLVINNANTELRDVYGNGAYELSKFSEHSFQERTIKVILFNKLSDEYKKSVNIPVVGLYYTIEEFRKLEILTGLRMGSTEEEDCDVGEFKGGKFIPVKINVSADNSIEWDISGSQLYIFCAIELQKWLKSLVPDYNMLQSKNPFNNKQIYGVQFLTQAEINEEVAKRNVPKTLKRKRESSEDRLEQLKVKLEMAKKNKKSKDEINLLKRTIKILESLISDSESDTDTDDEPAGIDPRSTSSYRLKF